MVLAPLINFGLVNLYTSSEVMHSNQKLITFATLWKHESITKSYKVSLNFVSILISMRPVEAIISLHFSKKNVNSNDLNELVAIWERNHM